MICHGSYYQGQDFTTTLLHYFKLVFLYRLFQYYKLILILLVDEIVKSKIASEAYLRPPYCCNKYYGYRRSCLATHTASSCVQVGKSRRRFKLRTSRFKFIIMPFMIVATCKYFKNTWNRKKRA